MMKTLKFWYAIIGVLSLISWIEGFSVPASVSKTSTRKFDYKGFECFSDLTKPSPHNKNENKKNPEVILIHGFGCSTVYWRETKKFLVEDGYTVHAVDLLGQGKSAKPGKQNGIHYSIDLWADMVNEYIESYVESEEIVLIGNSLGSVVALTVATNGQMKEGVSVKGIGMFNCGIGMNFRNILKEPNRTPFERLFLNAVFGTLDFLLFGNIPLLDYLLKNVVTKELLKETLINLYPNAINAEQRVDEELVDSFFLPAQDEGSVEALSQIYVNDAGKTPMQLHERSENIQDLPIHLVWGTYDNVTPLSGSVGQFYTQLSKNQKQKVTMDLVEGGHVLFDEVPECNSYMLKWLNQLALQ